MKKLGKTSVSQKLRSRFWIIDPNTLIDVSGREKLSDDQNVVCADILITDSARRLPSIPRAEHGRRLRLGSSCDFASATDPCVSSGASRIASSMS